MGKSLRIKDQTLKSSTWNGRGLPWNNQPRILREEENSLKDICVEIYTHPRFSQSDFPVMHFVAIQQ